MDLNNCIPKNKMDTDAVERARLVGFPTLNPILSELLVWVKDINWPVAHGTASLLSTAGPEIVPHIRDVLKTGDDWWEYWTIEYVVKKLDPNLIENLRSELARLTEYPTELERDTEVDVVAREVLTALDSSN